MSYQIRRNTIKPELFEHIRTANPDLYTPRYTQPSRAPIPTYTAPRYPYNSPTAPSGMIGGGPKKDVVEDVVTSSVCSVYSNIIKKHFKIFVIIVVIVVFLVRRYIQTAELKKKTKDGFNPSISIKHQKNPTRYLPGRMLLNTGKGVHMYNTPYKSDEYDDMIPYYDGNSAQYDHTRMRYASGYNNPYAGTRPQHPHPMYHNTYDYGYATNNFIDYAARKNAANRGSYEEIIRNNTTMFNNLGPFGIDNVTEIDPPYSMCSV